MRVYICVCVYVCVCVFSNSNKAENTLCESASLVSHLCASAAAFPWEFDSVLPPRDLL